MTAGTWVVLVCAVGPMLVGAAAAVVSEVSRTRRNRRNRTVME